MDVNLNELSGKIETESITFTTAEKVSPPIIDLLIYLYIILASTIVAIAVAVVFVKYRKKQQTPSEKPSKTDVSSKFY
jgi:NADH:ubiquinone oxidoreductase subunit K